MKRMIAPAIVLITVLGGLAYALVYQERYPTANLNELQLNGQLVMAQGQEGVAQFDMPSGAIETLFTPPGKGLVTAASVSPDGSQIVLAYAPPPEGLIQLGLTSLYIMPADASLPPASLLEAQGQEVLFNPAWSPDGQYIYYSRARASELVGLPSRNSLERIAYPDGEPELILENAHSPAFAADGSRIAYVARNSRTGGDNLFTANPDGTDPLLLMEQVPLDVIDAPQFSPDGQALIFGAADTNATSKRTNEAIARLPAWLALSPGVTVANAHGEVASDIWRVSIEGSQPSRLTNIGISNMVAHHSPKGNFIAIVTSDRLFLMNSGGTELSILLDKVQFRSLQWIP